MELVGRSPLYLPSPILTHPHDDARLTIKSRHVPATRYFDTWGVDVIFTPAQFCDAFTYEGMAGSTLSQRLDGMTTYDSSVSLCNFVAYCVRRSQPKMPPSALCRA
jgi:hypothetical protein